MPKRTDIKSILLIGSGPIIIGQACEFDYSGTQAIKALKEEGYKVILVNSNPATIMTDPDFADRTYIEPITADYVEEIIRQERPDAVLATMGGQTALNTALELYENGVFEKYSCELIGAKVDSIKMAEDRELFRQAMEDIGLESARSGLARSVDDSLSIAEEIGYPVVLRPSRTLGGSGGGIALDAQELKRKAAYALSLSPNKEVLIEESLVGWKEMELEVMRDSKDNVVIVCSIENFDPMGVHTGDSITVAPIQTLTDKEYQLLRDASIKVMRKIGVDTGGSNVQFAVNPKDGRIIVIEMNPRVSRSSALASKATGFPIAKIAAKLAVGYTLDEIPNDITKLTPACFEPSIDYVVVKIPRFNFEKFPNSDPGLGTQMKSVGECMAFGRTFPEAFQKALSSLELGSSGFDRANLVRDLGSKELLAACEKPTPDRCWIVAEALRSGHSASSVHASSGIDPWFLSQIQKIVFEEESLKQLKLENIESAKMRDLKQLGFSDDRLATLLKVSQAQLRAHRLQLGVKTVYKKVDTCAAEFEASTPYLYSCYDSEDEAAPSDRKKVIILGSGPNRIGQGIEFDYCCVHAVMALRAVGYEAIMVNCNPETVSTDYDISDRLYFEPLTFEHVLSIIDREKSKGEVCGVIVQFGGQTPLKLAEHLAKAGVPIVGTSVDSIDMAEDRGRFSELVDKLKLKQPASATAKSRTEALAAADKLGFPLMLRPSFVLGGRAMRTVYELIEVEQYISETVQVSNERPILMDRFLEGAIEVDIDAIRDGEQVIVCGVMEHIERAGIHSGDSSCSIPPQTLGSEIVAEIKSQTVKLANALNVIGLLNVQFAVSRDRQVYILEANPRASRTVPFVSKAVGIPWAKVAARVMLGEKIKNIEIKGQPVIEKDLEGYVAIKGVVFPFNKFPGVDTILGPEMKSTGEVMGIHKSFGGAFLRAQAGARTKLPRSGKVFFSIADADKQEALEIAKGLAQLGFDLVATSGTYNFLTQNGLSVEKVAKVREGSPHIVDMIAENQIALVINTPEGPGTQLDSKTIRLIANEEGVPTFTTLAAASAALDALQGDLDFSVKALQNYHLNQ
jgi:carbamoyl-phosphate synthase large subunit